jgi:acyl-coenzyme A synthetase/AMP-(fatty) acid ligase
MFRKDLLNRFTQSEDIKVVIQRGKHQTYKELILSIKEWQQVVLRNSIEPGQVVAIVSNYSFSAIALFLALYENNNIIVPITSLNEHEKKERIIISQCNASISIEDQQFILSKYDNEEKHPLIQEIVSKYSSGLVLFSSGSTGKPKAMIHNLDHLIDACISRKQRSINFLVFLMFDHIGGINTLLNCLAMGATITIPESRNPEEVCRLIQDYKVQVLPSSPTFLNLLLISESEKKYDLSSLILITYGTEPMPESLLLRLKNAFPRVKFLQTFGTSETGIIKTSSKSNTSTLLKFEDPQQEYKIVHGELWIRSETQILGYLNYQSESFTEDGWFRTGDIVKEEDGYIRIIGRMKEIINVGGEKVLPQEVETILLELDYIQDATVYAMPSPIVGEAVAVDLIVNQQVPLPDNLKAEIRNYCKSKLDNFKVPVKINIVELLNFSDRFKKQRK